MKNIFKNKKYLFLSLFILGLLMLSIGYAFITERLNVNGTTQIAKNNWVIYFDNIVENNNNVSTSNPAAIILPDKVQVDFNVELDKSQDSYEFTVDMVNDGSIDAQIDSIEKSALTLEQLKNLEYTITYSDGTPIKPCDILAANSRREIVVRVRLKENEKYLTVEEQNLDLSFEMNYLQYDKDKICNNVEDTYTLTIDPDGGIYNGSTDIVVIDNLTSGTKIVLNDAPTKEDYYFREWIKYNNDNYRTYYEEEINTVTIIDKNAYMKADFAQSIGPHTLFIDPNGGEYDGKTEITVRDHLPEGRIVKLGNDPVKVGENIDPDSALFDGWEAVNTVDYNTNYNSHNNSVTIEDRDAYVRAKWGKAVVRVETAEHEYVGRYASIQRGFEVAENGYFIYLLEDTTESPVNNNSGAITLDLDGHKVTGTLTNNGNLTLYNGIVENLDGTGVINNGTLTLGINDGTVLVDEEGTVALIGSSTAGIGLEQNGVFNFYDGYLEAKVGLKGSYADIPEEYFVYVNHNDVKNCQKVHLTKDISRAVAKDENELRYFNLQDAFNSGMEEDLDIFAIRDFEASYELYVDANEEVFFDLAGFEVRPGEVITNNGTFTITDTGRTVNNENQKGELFISKSITTNDRLNVVNTKITTTTDVNTIIDNGVLNLTGSVITGKGASTITTTSSGSVIGDQNNNVSSLTNYAVYVPTDCELSVGVGNIAGIYNKGKLTINEGTYNVGYLAASNTFLGMLNEADAGKTASVVMNGGTFDISSAVQYVQGISQNGSGIKNIELNGGTLNVTTLSLYCNAHGIVGNSSNIIINDLNMNVTATSGTAYAIYSNSNTTINGGTLVVNGGTSYGAVNGTAKLTGGNLIVKGTSGDAGIYNATIEVDSDFTLDVDHLCVNGNVTMNGGTMNCGTNGITTGGNFVMTDGTINASDVAVIIYTYGSGNITGGTIKSTASSAFKLNDDWWRSHVNVPLTISKATIEGQTSAILGQHSDITVVDSIIKGNTEYGINVTNSTLTLGIDDYQADDSASIDDSPSISGYSYGVYMESGSVNFYDGHVYGNVAGLNGNVTSTPDAYVVVTENIENDLKDSHLDASDYVAQVGSTKYPSLKQAINVIEETGTITILKSFNLTTLNEIPAEKDITIDLNNFEITANKSIKNNGNLTLKDSGTNGKIYFKYGNILENNGNLTINGGTYDSETADSATSYLIYNTKNVIMNDGLLGITEEGRAIPYAFYFIHSVGNDTSVTMNGGKIKSDYLRNVNGINGAINTTMTAGEIDIVGLNSSNFNGISGNNVYMSGGKISIDGNSIIGVSANYPEITGGEIEVVASSGGTGVGAKNIYWDSYDISGATITVRKKTAGTNPTLYGISGFGTIKNGTIINSDSVCVNSLGNGLLKIDGATLTCGGIGITAGSKSVQIDDVTVNSVDIALNIVDYSYQVVDVNGGTFISSNSAAIQTTGALKVNKVEGKEVIASGKTYGLYANTGYEVVIETGTYTGEIALYRGHPNPAYVAQSGKVNIYGGTFKGSVYGVHAKYAILNLGNAEDELLSEPVIVGKEKAIFVDGGTVNVNDGTYKTTGETYTGIIGMLDGYTLKAQEDEMIDGDTYSVKKLEEASNYLMVGTTEYNSLNKAVDAIVSQGGTGIIKMIDFGTLYSDVEIPLNSNITYDLNGFTLNLNKQITNNGNFTINDSSDDESGGMIMHLDYGLYNYGTMVINSGTYNTNNVGVIYNNGFSKTGGHSELPGELTINGGIFYMSSPGGNVSYVYPVIENYSLATLNMNGGTINVVGTGEGQFRGINGNAYYGNPTLNVNNVTITVNSPSYSHGIGNSYGATGTIINTTIDVVGRYGIGIELTSVTTNNVNIKTSNANATGLFGNSIGISSPQYDITGGKITTLTSFVPDYINAYAEAINGNGVVNGNIEVESEGICVYFGTVTINGGTFNCELSGIGIERYARNAEGNFTINGGTINAKQDGVYGNTVTINGGTIKSENRYGVFSDSNMVIDSTNLLEPTYIEGGTNGVHLKNGTATIKKGEIIGNTGYGTYSNGTLNLGEKDDTLSNAPLIRGNSYGVYCDNSKSFNFYDGMLEGQTAAYLGNISDQTADSLIEMTEETIDGNQYEVKYLVRQTEIVQNTTTNEKYINLNDAIAGVNSGEKLKMIDNASIFEEIINNNDNDVELDMNGFNIITTKNIANNKSLTIKNTNVEKDSKISTIQNVQLFKNNNNLILDNVSLENTSTNTQYVLVNSSTLNMNDVSVNGVYGVNNIGSLAAVDSSITSSNTALNDSGSISIDNCTIVGNSYGVYSTSSNDGEIKNSTITSNSSSFYKYSNDSTQKLTGNNITKGYVYNADGIMNLTSGSLGGYVNNLSTMTIDGTEILDDSSNIRQNVGHTSLINSGEMTINNVNYSISDSHEGDLNVIYNTGTLLSENNTINVIRSKNYIACNVYGDCGGYLIQTINNEGIFTSSGDIYNLNDTSEAVNPYTEFRGISNAVNGKINVEDLMVSTSAGKSSYGIYQDSSMLDNEINNVHFNDVDDTLVNFTLKSKNNNYGIYSSNGKISSIDNSIDVNGINSYGLYSDGGKIDAFNVDVKAVATNAYGVYSSDDEIVLRTGKIDVAGENAYGIYLNGTGATVTLGTLDGSGLATASMDNTNPEVKAIGSTLGVGAKKVNGTFNFYDGKLIGNTYAKPETANRTETGFEARYFLVHDDETVTEIPFGTEEGRTYEYEYSILEFLN